MPPTRAIPRPLPSVAVAGPPRPQNPGSTAGYWIAIAVLTLLFSRLIEFIPGPRPVAVLLTCGMLVSVFSRAVIRPLHNGVSLTLLAFTFWAGLSIPFSVWHGGSVAAFRAWLTSLVVYFVVSSLIDNLDRCRNAMVALAVSTLVLVVLSLFLGTDTNQLGRYSMDVQNAFSNSNMLAMLMLLGAPFCVLAASYWHGVRRVLAVAALGIIAVMVVRSGSRSGVMVLGLMTVFLFFRAGVVVKLQMLVGCVVLGLIAGSVSTESALSRFRTFYSSGENKPMTAEEISAMGSTVERAMLLHRSLEFTVQHPLLGVGMGQFMVADNNEATEEGKRGMWHVTHNSYTQISSETGLPALLFYGAAMFLCFRKLKTIRKRSRGIAELAPIESMAYALHLALILYACASFFVSSAYDAYFPILAGLCVAFESAAWQKIRAYESARPAAVQIPAAAVPLRRAAAAV